MTTTALLSPWARGWAFARSAASTARVQLLILLALHVLVWTWSGVASRSNLDTPGDMVEAYVWGQGWQWGYFKHPPLSAWVAGLWFAVVPESHWGYSLLSAVNVAVGLLGLAVLAREFLPRHWVLLAVAAASLTPGLSTLAMRFNANAILVSSWPWAMALFVRWMNRGRVRDAVLCGVVCGLAVLGKYYSGVLLLTLLCAGLGYPAWRRRFLSSSGAAAVLACAVTVGPHLLWLMQQTHGPLQYAKAASGYGHWGAGVVRALHFLAVMCIYPVLAWVVFAVSLRGPSRWRAVWQSASAVLRPRLQPVWLLAVLPVVATMVATVISSARTATVWGLPISAGLALLAVVRAREAGAELCPRSMWRAMACLWLLTALTAPGWWWLRAHERSPSATEPREELSQLVAWQWERRHGRPLPYVSGTRPQAQSVAFYAPHHPRYWSFWDTTTETPWVDTMRLMREGGAIVCAETDHDCQALADKWPAWHVSIQVSKSERGHSFEPWRYEVYLIEPGVSYSAPLALAGQQTTPTQTLTLTP